MSRCVNPSYPKRTDYFFRIPPILRHDRFHNQHTREIARTTSHNSRKQQNYYSSSRGDYERSGERDRERSRRNRDRDRDGFAIPKSRRAPKRSRSRSRGRRGDNRDRDRDRDRGERRARSRDRDMNRSNRQKDKGKKDANVVDKDVEMKMKEVGIKLPKNMSKNEQTLVKRNANVLRSMSVMRGPALLQTAGGPSASLARSVAGLPSVSVARGANNAPKHIKPKFMSKAQRERIDKQRTIDEKVKARTQQKDLLSKREQFLRRIRNSARDSRSSGGGRGGSGYYRYDSRGGNDGRGGYNFRERERAREKERRRDVVSTDEKNSLIENQRIKEGYLGRKKVKKNVVPPSQKFKFNFDWETTEDTSEDISRFFKTSSKISLQFGRGMYGGMDKDEQKRKNNEIYRSIFTKRKMVAKFEDEEMAKAYKEKKESRLKKQKEAEIVARKAARNWKQKSLQEMDERDWRIFKEEFRITTKFAGRLCHPLRYWEEANLPKAIYRGITEVAGYKDPSPIQRMAIPVGLKNRDCVGIAETGSGKTAAFVIPMLAYLNNLPPLTMHTAEEGCYALILAPTRELANQIHEETVKFSHFMPHFKAARIIGGIDIDRQSISMREGAEVIIATPGRLIDSLESRYVALTRCNYVVLDEADRMIDMGFEPSVIEIFECIPASNMRPEDEDEETQDLEGALTGTGQDFCYRQTFMFSATMPPAVERLTRKYLRNPVYVTIGDPNETAAERIRQVVLWIPEGGKTRQLRDLLVHMEPPIMIFVNTKKAATSVMKYCLSQAYSAMSLHGGKKQEHREDSLRKFKEGQCDILVCTNVAGRGIDVVGIQHVINYDMPSSIQDYCHRIGRTGRAGKEGTATSFITKEDTEIMYDLRKMLLKTKNKVPPELMSAEAALRDPRKPIDENKINMKKMKP